MSEEMPTDADELLIRLVRVARGLEEQRASYGGRVWWAAVHSLLMERSLERGIPKGSHELEELMKRSLEGLRRAGVEATLLAALERTQELVEEQEMVTWDEFGHLLFCRHCGRVSFGERELDCPRCGAHWLTRRRLPPIWFLEPLRPKVALDSLSTMPDLLAQKLEGLSEDQLRQRPAEDEWSLREVLEHLWLAQAVMQERIVRMLEEDDPRFEGVEITTEDQAGWTTVELLQDFRSRRESMLERISDLGYEDWNRPGWHQEFGEITVLIQASYMVKHEGYHLRQLDEVRRAIFDGSAPGL